MKTILDSLPDFRNYFRLLRMRDWRGYFLIATFGFILGKGFLFPLKDIIVFYAILFLYLGFAFSMNDCFDTKEDKLDKNKKNPVADQKIGFRNALFFSIFLAILALALSAVFGLKVFLFSSVIMLLAFSYSASPLRMKSRPFLDLVSHGLFAGALIFLMPILIFSKDLSLFHYLIAISIFYFSITLELRNHVEDYETDKKAGLKTTVCALGFKKSERLLRYLAFLYPLTIFPILLLAHQQYLLLFLILTLVFFFFFLFKKDYRMVRNYKIMDAYVTLSFSILLLG